MGWFLGLRMVGALMVAIAFDLETTGEMAAGFDFPLKETAGPTRWPD